MADSLQLQAEMCAQMIERSYSIVLLSGAGMSTNAGLPDFRGPNGIYRQKMNVDPEMIFDIDHFRVCPEFFYSFHREFISSVEKISPTFGHVFFAALENTGKMTGIITQNIDALHQKAGSKNVLEIHGSSWKNFCTRCGHEYSYNHMIRKMENEKVPRCEKCGGVIKPDIVFFGENVKNLYECQNMASEADLMLVAGSSLAVFPAALLPSMCRGKIIIVNKGEISLSYLPEERITLHIEEDIDAFFMELNSYLRIV
ncbi:MAG TPA: Sir2 family NAD-dependent protein deacetylase [Synergistales bacterium]|mgnify:CR=1 FL=1|nr:Sir2 family NAD-dependent protein deacetylase [Synergistales bacterium]